MVSFVREAGLSLLKPFLLRFTGPWRKFERNWNRTLPWKTLPTWRMSDSIWYFRKSLQGLTCQIYPYYAFKWLWYVFHLILWNIYMYILYKNHMEYIIYQISHLYPTLDLSQGSSKCWLMAGDVEVCTLSHKLQSSVFAYLKSLPWGVELNQ